MTTLKPALLAAAALGLTVLLIQPNPTFADTTRTPTAAAKFKSSGGGATPAQPGDTCLGVSACNTLIVECIESGHDFKPIEDSPSGEPYYGQCVKRTD
jgi:hypothetical protein